MISVVTPSFGQLDWLALAASSVADQGVDLEHIVQDGGTPGIEASGLSGKAQLFVEKDHGMYDAINRGLRRARGEICAYLNCDEQYLPETLAKVGNYFRSHPKIDVLFGDAVLTDADGTPISYRRVVLPSAAHVRLVHLNTLSCATFFRRRLLERGFYFDPAKRAIGDTAWVYSLLQAEIKMGTLWEPLATFTFTGENLGATAISEAESKVFRVKERFPRARGATAIVSHRLRKLFAGAYRRRRVDILIYTRASPFQRQRRINEVGFRWPKGSL